MIKYLIYLFIFILLLIGAAWFKYPSFIQSMLEGIKMGEEKKITTFIECSEAGYPIMETYPAQCKTPDNQTFVEQEVNLYEDQLPMITQAPENPSPINQ